jgi:hypothetical protein
LAIALGLLQTSKQQQQQQQPQQQHRQQQQPKRKEPDRGPLQASFSEHRI